MKDSYFLKHFVPLPLAVFERCNTETETFNLHLNICTLALFHNSEVNLLLEEENVTHSLRLS